MSKIEIQISSSRPVFIEADADAFGQVFAGMSSDEQVAVFRAMVEHMKPHRLQWDYIAIELEQRDENREARKELYDVLFPADTTRALIETLTAALAECEDYFDNRADADCDQDGFIPNEEMKLLQGVREALAAAKEGF